MIRILNMIGHILQVGVVSLATAYGRDLNTPFVWFYSLFIGYMVSLGIEVEQFSHHYQNTKYNDRYRKMIFEKFGSKTAVESWIAYAWRTYDRDKTRFDLILVNGLLGCICGALFIWLFLM